jgi:hypothetical protein
MFEEIYGSNSQWLKADDLQGAKPVVVIESAEVKENTYNGETKKQIVLKFQGKDKLLGLNFTNASHLAELTGTQDYTKWIGTAIKLYATTVKVDGVPKPAIRIFPELPNSAAAATAPAFSGAPTADDDIPF